MRMCYYVVENVNGPGYEVYRGFYRDDHAAEEIDGMAEMIATFPTEMMAEMYAMLRQNEVLTTVWAVSHVYWNGDEQGGGGFNWTTDRNVALDIFEEEKEAWAGIGAARVRLVKVALPSDASSPCPWSGCLTCVSKPITCWIDAHIDGIEAAWEAEKVWLNPGF